MAEAKEKKSRKSRKHKREEDMVEMVEEAETVSRKSKKSKKEKKHKRARSAGSEEAKRSKKSKKSKKSERAYMADGEEGDAPPAEAPAEDAAPPANEIPPPDPEVEKAVEEGKFNSEMLTNVDAEDEKRIQDKAFQQTSVNCRGRMHDCMDDVEIFCDIMLTDALNNKASRQRVLQQRTKILKILWGYRETADCEDDFDNEEFHGQMRVLATIQRKLKGLDSKIGAMMMGAEQSSSDSDGQGEMDGLKKLKTARQNLRYAMNQGTFVA